MKKSNNLMKIFFSLIFTVLIFSGCQKTELGKEIYLHIGEKQEITSRLSFTIDSLWDSRCPTGLVCFWDGDVAMSFNIIHSHKQIDTLLRCFPAPNVVPFEVVGYKWKVLEVNPYPNHSYSTNQKDIIIKMIITED